MVSTGTSSVHLPLDKISNYKSFSATDNVYAAQEEQPAVHHPLNDVPSEGLEISGIVGKEIKPPQPTNGPVEVYRFASELDWALDGNDMNDEDHAAMAPRTQRSKATVSQSQPFKVHRDFSGNNPFLQNTNHFGVPRGSHASVASDATIKAGESPCNLDQEIENIIFGEACKRMDQVDNILQNLDMDHYRTRGCRSKQSKPAIRNPASPGVSNATAKPSDPLSYSCWIEAENLFKKYLLRKNQDEESDPAEDLFDDLDDEQKVEGKLFASKMAMFLSSSEIRSAALANVVRELQQIREFSVGTVNFIASVIEWVCCGRSESTRKMVNQARIAASSQAEMDPESDAWKTFEIEIYKCAEALVKKVSAVAGNVQKHCVNASEQVVSGLTSAAGAVLKRRGSSDNAVRQAFRTQPAMKLNFSSSPTQIELKSQSAGMIASNNVCPGASSGVRNEQVQRSPASTSRFKLHRPSSPSAHHETLEAMDQQYASNRNFQLYRFINNRDSGVFSGEDSNFTLATSPSLPKTSPSIHSSLLTAKLSEVNLSRPGTGSSHSQTTSNHNMEAHPQSGIRYQRQPPSASNFGQPPASSVHSSTATIAQSHQHLHPNTPSNVSNIAQANTQLDMTYISKILETLTPFSATPSRASFKSSQPPSKLSSCHMLNPSVSSAHTVRSSVHLAKSTSSRLCPVRNPSRCLNQTKVAEKPFQPQEVPANSYLSLHGGNRPLKPVMVTLQKLPQAPKARSHQQRLALPKSKIPVSPPSPMLGEEPMTFYIGSGARRTRTSNSISRRMTLS